MLPKIESKDVFVDPNDLEENFTRGSGAGGQHRNKVATAVVLKHKLSGIVVRSEIHKSQKQNRETAYSVLVSKLEEAKRNKNKEKLNNKRREQIGSGMRGDKIRTIQVQNNLVICHNTNKKTSYKSYKKGNFKDLK